MSGIPVNKSQAAPMMREMIAQDPHSYAMYDGNSAINLAKKVRYGGDKYHFEIQVGHGDNTGYSAPEVLLKRNQWSKHRFECDTVESYNAKDVTHRALREVRTEDAFIDLLENLKHDLDQAAGEEAEKVLFKNHGNARAQISTVGTNVIQLTSALDARQVSIGVFLRFATTDGTSGSLKLGVAQVIRIDEGLGKLYCTGNWSDAVATIANADYIFLDGSFGYGRQGLPSWLPATAPSSGTLFNTVDRAVHETRLAGHRVTASLGDIAGSWRDILTRIKGSGGKGTNTVLTSVEMASRFCEQLEQKVTYNDLEGEAGIGISSVKFQAAGMKLNVVDSWACPDNVAYVLPKEKLEIIHSTDGLMEVVDEDGNIFARNATDFSYDVRTISIFNFVLRNMQGSGVVTYS